MAAPNLDSRERFAIQAQTVIERAANVHAIAVTTPTYVFAVVNLLGQLQQTRFHSPEQVISFNEEVTFDAQFELSWDEQDISSFLHSKSQSRI